MMIMIPSDWRPGSDRVHSVLCHRQHTLSASQATKDTGQLFTCFVSFSELSSHFKTSLADFVIIEIGNYCLSASPTVLHQKINLAI